MAPTCAAGPSPACSSSRCRVERSEWGPAVRAATLPSAKLSSLPPGVNWLQWARARAAHEDPGRVVDATWDGRASHRQEGPPGSEAARLGKASHPGAHRDWGAAPAATAPAPTPTSASIATTTRVHNGGWWGAGRASGEEEEEEEEEATRMIAKRKVCCEGGRQNDTKRKAEEEKTWRL
jgi:hypothetical protein